MLYFYYLFQMSCCFNILWLFLTVPWVGLQCAIVVFPVYTHLPYCDIEIYTFCLISYNLMMIDLDMSMVLSQQSQCLMTDCP